jgi:hypothetical protein
LGVSHAIGATALQVSGLPSIDRVCASLLLAAVLILACGPKSARAQALSQALDKTYEIETEHMFGFTQGSDIGRSGESEIEVTTTGRFGRDSNAYNVLSTTAEYKYPLSGAFRISGMATISHYGISGVDGLDDRNQFVVDNFAVEFDLRFLDRRKAPFGLTLIAVPFFGFVDGSSGAPADQYGSDFVLAADRELVPDRLFVAVNVAYGFEGSRDHATGVVSDGSSLAFQFGAAARLAPWLYVGAEARYQRAYIGIGLDTLSGQAVYVGPNFYAPVARGVTVSGAWNFQAWGRADVGGGTLDLVNFERHQALLRVEFDF